MPRNSYSWLCATFFAFVSIRVCASDIGETKSDPSSNLSQLQGTGKKKVFATIDQFLLSDCPSRKTAERIFEKEFGHSGLTNTNDCLSDEPTGPFSRICLRAHREPELTVDIDQTAAPINLGDFERYYPNGIYNPGRHGKREHEPFPPSYTFSTGNKRVFCIIEATSAELVQSISITWTTPLVSAHGESKSKQ